MYGVEVFDGETARFEVVLSEDDVHGQWKLNGEVLSPSAVSIEIKCIFNDGMNGIFIRRNALNLIGIGNDRKLMEICHLFVVIGI